ncbi:uncharacterized protein LOC120349960 [Nilaparvata lugens]|uniref:uncharacterized protein LOC120349960 n=1 Tax=Nilaparvata lugens TaxID=108931 RepID=UPI00193E5DD0|nr:uncharacterized protein LOC120349960 [Nilaparvata lugens]
MDGAVDQRLVNLEAYVRRFYVGIVGGNSMFIFQARRRMLNNDAESYYAKLLTAFGPNLNVWTFIRLSLFLQTMENESYANILRMERGVPVRREGGHTSNTEVINRALCKLIAGQYTLCRFLMKVGHCADDLTEMANRQLAAANGAETNGRIGDVDWMLPVAAEEVFVATANRPRQRQLRPRQHHYTRPQEAVQQQPLVDPQQPMPCQQLQLKVKQCFKMLKFVK